MTNNWQDKPVTEFQKALLKALGRDDITTKGKAEAVVKRKTKRLFKKDQDHGDKHKGTV